MSSIRQFGNVTTTSEGLKRPRYADSAVAQPSNPHSVAVKPQQNRLLQALPKDFQNRLFPCLQLELLQPGKIIHECGRHSLSQIVFPIDSIVSLLCTANSGSCTEVAMVGNEGLVGLAALLGGGSSTVRAQVCRGGHAFALPAQRLRMEFNNNTELRMVFLRYAQSLFESMAQTAYCNRRHSICDQFCRWLLLSLDRLPGNELNMTQEMIANTLGVRVASISEVACKLQKLQVINYHRGRITVLDRPKLENIACECYAAIRNQTRSPEDSFRRINLAV